MKYLIESRAVQLHLSQRYVFLPELTWEIVLFFAMLYHLLLIYSHL